MLREELVEGYVRGDITRRTFVRRLTVAGVSLAAALSYADLLRPEAAQAFPGEDDLYETDKYADSEKELPPDVITEAPADIAHDRATARAQIDPNLQLTAVRFEVGPPGGPYATFAAPEQSGDVDRRVAAALTGLTPNASYVVRAVAVNGSGATEGEFVAFATTHAPVKRDEQQGHSQPPAPVAQAADTTPAPVPVVPPADARGPFVKPARVTTTLKQVLRTGVLPVSLTSDEDATADLVATLSTPVKGVRAALSRKRKVTVASGRVRVRGGARATTARLKVTRAGKRELRRRSAATLTLEVHATDAARNKSLLRVGVKLK